MKKQFVFKSEQQIEDFVKGCTFFGTGGGGNYKEGVDVLVKQLRKGGELGWVNALDLDDDGYSCCPFLMGSIAPETPEVKKEREEVYGLGEPLYNNAEAMVAAVKNLEKTCGKHISVLVPIELGGGNTAACIAAASILGIDVANGDYTGRAIPEIQQTTPNIAGKSLLPISSVDWWGNVAVVQEAANWRMAERIGKMISAAGYAKCAQAGFLLPIREMKKILIHSTLDECLEAGTAISNAVMQNEDPADAVSRVVCGNVVFRGTLTEQETKDHNGYFWGTNTFSGQDNFAGQKMKIWFKNENHLSWINGKPYITSPDMLQVIDRHTGQPYTNNTLSIGQEVSIVAIPARSEFRTQKGLEILSPKAFGFDWDYIPAEKYIK